MSKPTLIVGRVTTLKDGIQAIEPIDSSQLQRAQTLAHQTKMAALIAAAYLYRDHPTAENLVKLSEAAADL